MKQVDWIALAQSASFSSRPNSIAARDAIANLLGDDLMRDAVDAYVVAADAGSELARSVLWQLHPPVAMDRCKELIETSSNPEVRINAVELLRVVADARVLPWISGFLSDPEPGVQFWGVGIVDQLIFSHFVTLEEAEPILRLADASTNTSVREQAAKIRAFYSQSAANGSAESSPDLA